MNGEEAEKRGGSDSGKSELTAAVPRKHLSNQSPKLPIALSQLSVASSTTSPLTTTC